MQTGQQQREVPRLSPQEVKKQLDRGEQILFIDTRNPQAWSESDVKLQGALRIPADQISQHLGEIPRDREIVTYCT
ncbi:MAG TPA: rhodanese-like domain-containing protein [Blastocatellia bacterium]|nr:rhodanese-like domain-containing protein [Blastocatellia bacterium]